MRAANVIVGKTREVLSGTRSGRVYKKTGTYGKKPSSYTKSLMKDYGHKLREGQLYRASAPGEAPASRKNTLRRSFQRRYYIQQANEKLTVHAMAESKLKVGKHLLAEVLDKGTKDRRILPRPFAEKAKQEALPEVQRIYNEPYQI